MSLFSFSFGPNINKELVEIEQVDNKILLDVRTPEEYKEGHLPGSVNIPLQNIDTISNITSNTDTPIFIYCHSGVRSSQASNALKFMGYTNVKNIGGITSYTGIIEK